MSFRLTYEEIKEMVLDTVLYTPTARDIVRRAGIRFGSTSLGANLFARFGYRYALEPPPRASMEVPYEEQTIVPYYADQPLPAGATYLVKTLSPDTAVQIEQAGYYRVQATMRVFISEIDIPFVIQIFACARDADFNLQRLVLLDEQFFPSEPLGPVEIGDPEDEGYFFTEEWWINYEPQLDGQNIIAANADEVMTIDLLIHFLGDPSTTSFDYAGFTVLLSAFDDYRQWIELLNPPLPAE